VQAPTATSSLPPSVPTAPRSHQKIAAPIARNVNPNRIPSSSYKWTKPPDKEPSESRFQDVNQPESPRSVGHAPHIVTDAQNVANRDDNSPRESVFSRDAISTGDRFSPRDSGPNIEHPLEKDSSSPKVDDREKEIGQASEKAPEEKEPPIQRRKQPSKRRVAIGKHLAKPPSPERSSMYMSSEEEDSEDDVLDDNYFEREIELIEKQLLEAEEQNPLNPRSELNDIDIGIVKPLSLSIDDIIATKPLNIAEPCEAPIVKPESSPQPPPTLAPEPKPKSMSRPSTTQDAESLAIPRVNGKDTSSHSESSDFMNFENSNAGASSHSTAPVSSISLVENPSTRIDASEGRTSPQPRSPARTMINGRPSKVNGNEEEQTAQNEDTHMEDGTTVPDGMAVSDARPDASHVAELQVSRPSQSEVGNIALIPARPRMEQLPESEDEQNVREREEERDAALYQAIRVVKPVPSGRAAMYKGPFAQTHDPNINGHSQEDLAAVRKMMKTPPISRLPKFNVGSCWDDPGFLTSLEIRNPILDEKIRRKLRDQAIKTREQQYEEGQQWAQRYRDYRKWTDFSDDEIAIRSRETFAESRARAAAEAAAPAASSVASASTKPEGRRPGNRWATERDFERVLRESEQEAREKKEQDERAARAKTASTKEAIIPPMYWDDEEWDAMVFKDKTHAVSFERSFAVLEYGEPIDNFSEEEAATFEKVYLEFPKQFDKIAAELPKRDFKACIQHYYLVKHELDLKPKAKEREKKKKGRRGPAKGSKPKANALTASLGTADDNEDGQENENPVDGRRRPRRAAAPVFPIDAPVSENEVASPAPTPGRKSTNAPKTDTGNESGPRKKVKIAPQKTAKQAKNSQPLAAAPIAAANRQVESPAPAAPVEWKNRKEPSGSNRFPSQFDGAPQGPPTTTFAPPFVGAEKPGPSMAPSFEVMPQPYPSQERVDSNTPMGFDPQQDRRNVPQTSSYWSVPEVNDFPALLRHFGTDWQGIAKHMTTKTHIMVYQNLFHQWLIVPLDTNKSRRVANIQTQVKNYYQRSVDSGKNREWEDIARDADAKRDRGEPTGPLPAATPIPSKKRFDNAQGSVPRSGSAMEGIEDMSSPGMNAVMTHASPPQGIVSTRFPALAQAGPVPHIQPAASASVLNKSLPPQAQQQAPQAQQGRPRGPQLGYFNTESPRPILQAQQSDPIISQRSRQVAQEAKIERENALRVEQEQKQQMEQLHHHRVAEQQQQQQALQRERQYPHLKQENDVTNLNQVEAYSTPPMHSNMSAHSRPEATYQSPHPEVRRSTVPPQPPQQYQPRPSHAAVRNLLSDSPGVPREMKPSPSPSHGSSHAPPPMPTPRAPVSAPPVAREQYQVPPQPKPQIPQAAAARQQETVRKTSNIMSLLNDEPSDPRPEPPKRVANVSTPQPTSRTPPPLPQHPLHTNRFAAHSSQPPQPPQHTAQKHQMPQQPLPPQAPQQHPSHSQNPYAQPDPYAKAAPHSVHQHSSSIGHPRSYTPNSFDSRGYSAKPSVPPQPMYPQQQSRQSMAPQPSAIRREPSLGESVHAGGLSGGYSRSGPSQSMRLQESPYSSTSSPAPTQAGRQQIASPLDHAPPNERDYYSRQSQFMMQQQGSAAGSPQLGPSQYSQPQAPPPSNHRQLAFGQTQSHVASPPSHYATQHMQRSRHNSFDGRFPTTGSAGSTPSHPGYAQPPHHQPAPPQMQYPPTHPSQERFGESSYERERRIIEERRLIDERRMEDRRIIEDRERRIQEDHYRRSMDERR